MHQYDRNNDRSDSFGWEEEDEFDFLSQRFEKNSDRKAHNGKVDARRRAEDHQEKRRLKKRVRLSIDRWDNVD